MPSPYNYIKLKLMTKPHHATSPPLSLMPMPLSPAVIIPLVLLSIQFLLIGPQASMATALSFSAITTTSVSLVPGFLGNSFITGTCMVLPKWQNQECAGPHPHLLTLEVICHQLCTEEQSLAKPNVCWWPSLSYSCEPTNLPRLSFVSTPPYSVTPTDFSCSIHCYGQQRTRRSSWSSSLCCGKRAVRRPMKGKLQSTSIWPKIAVTGAGRHGFSRWR